MYVRPSPAAHPTAAVPADALVYAVGDVHGRRDLLDRLLATVAADAAQADVRRRLVVFLGDYVDRGPWSRQVVDRLVAGPEGGFDWVCLKGNHEDMLLRFLDDAGGGAAWLSNGGLETVASYCPGRPLTGLGLAELRALLRDHLPDDHRRFFEGLALSHAEGDYFFVHAGVRPGRALAAQAAEDMLWIRAPFLTSGADFGKVVVHGHSIVAQPQQCPNPAAPTRIAIDTGAYRTGRLTALALKAQDRRFLST